MARKVHLEDNKSRTPPQATNSEFPVGRVYFDVRLNLVGLDAGADVQVNLFDLNASGIVPRKCRGRIATREYRHIHFSIMKRLQLKSHQYRCSPRCSSPSLLGVLRRRVLYFSPT